MEVYNILKEKYGNIEKYCLESGDWEGIAVEAFKEGKYTDAIENFEKVIVAIPDHYNGYEMCSYSFYRDKQKEKAIIYLEEGIKVAKKFDGETKLPQEMINDMEISLKAIKDGKELDKAYLEEIME